uniref:Uncharacterized protein n=1 Tax=Anguilla anguilla TaxID=7936 RepID=A0A0E9QM13_ANGAN
MLWKGCTFITLTSHLGIGHSYIINIVFLCCKWELCQC